MQKSLLVKKEDVALQNRIQETHKRVFDKIARLAPQFFYLTKQKTPVLLYQFQPSAKGILREH